MCKWKATALLVLLVSLPSARGQLTFREDLLHGRKALVLDNSRIQVSVLRGGGHIGEMRFVSDDPKRNINALYVPSYQTIEPYEYDVSRHRQRYGSALSAGYMGHMLCFPWFGPPSPEERTLGLGVHGEAATVEWKQSRPTRIDNVEITVAQTAELPLSQYRITRTLSLRAGEGILYIEENFENLASFDRPYNRDGHATFGMPFVSVGKTFFDTSARQGLAQVRPNHSLLGGREFRWPEGVGPNGRPVDLRGLQNIPGTNTLYALTADQGRRINYFTLYSTDYRVLVGFLLPTTDHTWIVDWQNNQGDRFMRGIEFGTSPFDEGLRKSVERGSLFGLPTYRWIAARGRISVRYAMFVAEIPEDFKGVADIETSNGKITVVERENARRLVLSIAADWP